MDEICYFTMLVSAILLSIMNILTRRPTKVWRYIMYCLAGICVVAVIGFVVTTLML